ncbi:MAG: nitroreductase family protein [Pseudomonadota bacterium]
MKKNMQAALCTFIVTAVMSVAPVFECKAETLQTVVLSDPKVQFAKHQDSLFFALENRHTERTFSEQALDMGELSALLWAACGVNRDNGKLTIPTSRNTQDMLIYILKNDGVWLYDASTHAIEQKSSVDIRPDLTTKIARSAPVTFLYVNDVDKASNARSGDRHSGSMYQNVGLYCAIAGLHNVVTGTFPKDLETTLNMPKNHKIMIAQSVGAKP